MTETQPEHVSHFDWTAVSPPVAVVEALEELTGRAVDDQESLYQYVDPDALETLVTSNQSGDESTVTFRYDSYLVTVDGSGTVAVAPVD